MAFKPVRSRPVIVQNRDALECIAGLLQATGTITFGANATTTKVLVLYGQTFEFLADVADVGEGNIPVQIGEDAEETRDNLLAALADLTRVQVDTPLVAAVASDADTILLTYWEVGTVGNTDITKDDDNVTVTGMSGGADGDNTLTQLLTILTDVYDAEAHALRTKEAV